MELKSGVCGEESLAVMEFALVKALPQEWVEAMLKLAPVAWSLRAHTGTLAVSPINESKI